MGKRSRQKRLSRSEPTPSSASPNPGPACAAEAASSRRRPAAAAPAAPPPGPAKRWLFRFVLLALVPALVLGLTELALRVAGYGYSTQFFVPHERPGYLTTNPRFAWQYYSRETATTPTPLLFPAGKPAGTLRIILLGESAAAGTPDPAYGFARILEVMLRRQYPSNRFEILNAAMRGINSHIILPIARECAALSPDLFLVYMGNNELIGLHAPSHEELNLTPHLRLLRLGQAIKSTRLAQLTQALLRKLAPKREPKPQDMEFIRRQRLALDDPLRDAVYANFRANLSEIRAANHRAGTSTIVATLGVNLHDFPPLASLHRRDLAPDQLARWEKAYAAGIAAEAAGQFDGALAHYEAAAGIDDHFAELHFRLARCYEAAGRTEPAQRYFVQARDWDALQFRADTRLNAVIRSVSAAGNAATPDWLLCDIERALAESPAAEHGLPGRQMFHEHVHFTFAGDYEVARALLPSVTGSLRLGAPAAPLPSQTECAHALAFTPVDDLNVRAAMARQTARPPFLDQLDHGPRQAEADKRVQEQLARTTRTDFEQAAAVYREALAANPEDWMFHFNYGNLLNQFNQPAAAAAEYEVVVQEFPRHRAFRLAYGNALLQSGRAPLALAQFDTILQLDPDFQPAREALAAARRRLR